MHRNVSKACLLSWALQNTQLDGGSCVSAESICSEVEIRQLSQAGASNPRNFAQIVLALDVVRMISGSSAPGCRLRRLPL